MFKIFFFIKREISITIDDSKCNDFKLKLQMSNRICFTSTHLQQRNTST